MLRDLMPALIEQEETLIETLCASVCSGAGSFTAFQLVHKLVTEGLLPNAMAGIALRLQERVQHVQNAPAAAQEIWPPPGFKRDADGRADAPPTPATPPPPAAAQEGGQRTSAEVLPAGAPDAVAPAAEPAGQNHMYECLFPGCGRRYASSDATRKHARKQHRGWLESLPAQGPTHYCREVPGSLRSGFRTAPPSAAGGRTRRHRRPGLQPEPLRGRRGRVGRCDGHDARRHVH